MGMGPLVGLLVNRFGCRVTAISGAILCVLGLLITSFAKHLEFMYFSYGIVYGCASSLVVLTSFVVVTKAFTKWRSLAVGVSAGGLSSGYVVFSPTMEAILSAVGWRNLFRIVAGITTLVIFVSCVYGPKQEMNDPSCEAENEHKGRMFDFSVVTNYRWILLTLGTSLAYFARSIGQVSMVSDETILLIKICLHIHKRDLRKSAFSYHPMVATLIWFTF